MSKDDYMKARRLGLKAAQTALDNHESINLPTLAERLPKLDQMAHIPLGMGQIHTSMIKGTATQGRTSAFADNFMPLLDSDTEFASKWSNLCESVRTEGIQQAVTVLEYMGKCYLVEGNKRVSVAKYLHIEYLDADITRVMPERDGSPEVEAYYEYCAFSKDTGIFDLIFTTPGDYEQLLTIMRRGGRDIHPEEWHNLRTLVRYFREAYHQVMDSYDFADAFLSFLIAYGYYNINRLPQDDIIEKVKLMKAEFQRFCEGESISLILNREEAYTMVPAFLRPSAVRAAFLYVSPPEVSGWNHWHELGRINAESRMEGKLITSSHVIPSRSAFVETVEQLLEEKVQLIFATSPVMLNSCIAPSLQRKDTHFYCCAPVPGYAHVRGYYLRFYEAKFLMGLVAGVYARNGKIGYVADYPINGTASAINAFARGVAMVNPFAKIYLTWNSLKDFDSNHPFEDEEIRVISNRDINAPSRSSLAYGLYLKEENGNIRNLAAPLVDWSYFYATIADHYLKGGLNEDAEGLAQSYWWGMSSGALDLALATHFDSQTAQLVEHFLQEIREDRYAVFSGECPDQEGGWICRPHAELTPGEIFCMKKLAANVVGSYPPEKDLKRDALPIVRLQGPEGRLQPNIQSVYWQGV